MKNMAEKDVNTMKISPIVWKNGEVIKWDDARIHVMSHVVHYGSSVFEGIRCYATEEGPAVFRLDAHLERLYASAAVYGLEIAHTREELTEAVGEVIYSGMKK